MTIIYNNTVLCINVFYLPIVFTVFTENLNLHRYFKVQTKCVRYHFFLSIGTL